MNNPNTEEDASFNTYRAAMQAQLYETRARLRTTQDKVVFWRVLTLGAIITGIITHLIRSGW